MTITYLRTLVWLRKGMLSVVNVPYNKLFLLWHLNLVNEAVTNLS